MPRSPSTLALFSMVSRVFPVLDESLLSVPNSHHCFFWGDGSWSIYEVTMQKKGLRPRPFFKHSASQRSAERSIRCPDAKSRLTSILRSHVGSPRSGFGPNATSPLRFQWRGGVRSVSVSRVSILGIKTGRGIGHTTRGRKEGIEGRKKYFHSLPASGGRVGFTQKSSYAGTGKGVLCTLMDSFTLHGNL